jgi:hypothetical protein
MNKAEYSEDISAALCPFSTLNNRGLSGRHGAPAGTGNMPVRRRAGNGKGAAMPDRREREVLAPAAALPPSAAAADQRQGVDRPSAGGILVRSQRMV